MAATRSAKENAQRAKAVGIMVIFFAGSIAGARFEPDPDPKIEYIKVPHTKIIHQTETKVVHKGFTDACKEALDLANTITHASEGFDSTSTEQLELLSRSRIAMVEGNMNETSRIITDQNDLDSRTLQYVVTISENLNDYDIAKKECEADDSTN